MAQVIAFPKSSVRSSAQRTPREPGDRAGFIGKVVIFTGVWHETTHPPPAKCLSSIKAKTGKK